MRLSTGLILVAALIFATPGYSWNSAQLLEPVRVGEVEITHPEFAVFPLPGTRLAVSSASALRLVGAPGPLASQDLTELAVPAEPGWYDYRLLNTSTGQELLLHVYALTPYSGVSPEGYIDSYRVGNYPTERLRDLPIYDPPAGFVRVDEADADIRLSPNFTVGQFLSKQSGSYPKYLVLRSALIIQLEQILQALNESGREIDSMYVMSGYRTPYYNRAIGNVPYSRHQWGGAADIYIDVNPRDGRMDDLDGNGEHDKRDAVWLAEFIDAMVRAGKFASQGGLGIYGSNAAHGPFVHVDVRGYQARW
jgi:Peptidase M15